MGSPWFRFGVEPDAGVHGSRIGGQRPALVEWGRGLERRWARRLRGAALLVGGTDHLLLRKQCALTHRGEWKRNADLLLRGLQRGRFRRRDHPHKWLASLLSRFGGGALDDSVGSALVPDVPVGKRDKP